MQIRKRSDRRSNRDRTAATRAALIAAARRLFVEHGFAETATPDVVAAAGVTRGALYHHFRDKSELFVAVARQMAGEVRQAIEHHGAAAELPIDALCLGAEAYFDAMSASGRARLLLVEAPSILPASELAVLNSLTGEQALCSGLERALSAADTTVPIRELTALVSAAFDRAALAIAEGENEQAYRSAVRLLLRRLVRPD